VRHVRGEEGLTVASLITVKQPDGRLEAFEVSDALATHIRKLRAQVREARSVSLEQAIACAPLGVALLSECYGPQGPKIWARKVRSFAEALRRAMV